MIMGKSKEIRQEAKQAKERLDEINRLIEEAKVEEQAIITRVKAEIDSMCEADNLFCGVILTTEDIIAIVKLAFETKETIKIPYNIYFND
jgi:hypothetical protein